MTIKNLEGSYGTDTWIIEERRPDWDVNQKSETVFSLANGFLGLRGEHDEVISAADSSQGTFINGFYESSPIQYGESAYGFPKFGQTMVNVMNPKRMLLEIEGQVFDPSNPKFKIISYNRALDLRQGYSKRTVQFETDSGKQFELHSIRLASFTLQNLAICSYTVTALNSDCSIKVTSFLDGAVSNQKTGDDPRIGSHLKSKIFSLLSSRAENGVQTLVQETLSTKFTVACSTKHLVTGVNEVKISPIVNADKIFTEFLVDLKQGQSVKLDKFCLFATSLDCMESDLGTFVEKLADAAATKGLDHFLEAQEAYCKEFWHSADVEIKGDPLVQQSIRFSMFHLLQSAGRDGRANIAAKGLTGEGYEGHYFWDTEIYVLPFFISAKPDIARQLLKSRINMLNHARNRAAEMAQKGALYAWRTIAGQETSAYFPAGTAQYHINGDIAFALQRYFRATNDKALLIEGGAEMLFETARLWADLGCYIENKGFCINTVTGPDEYTAIVDNNTYTNLLAREHFLFAIEIAELMKSQLSTEYNALINKIALSDAEIQAWKKAADQMYVPVDKQRGILCQDDSFLSKEPWDFKNTPKDKYPLLLNFHPLVIYRKQVLKQADVVLAMMLHWDQFSRAQKKRNFDFYEPLTTHDSSLSMAIHSVIAAEIGYSDQAYEYFMHSARCDLDDLHGNTKHGVHCASMAGSWLSIVNGFGGFKESKGEIHFSPVLPEKWQELSFRVRHQGNLLKVDILPRETRYTLLEGASEVSIFHKKQSLKVKLSQTVVVSHQSELKLAIFDLDGVVTDTAELHYEAWKALAESLDIPFDREFNEKLKGVSRIDSLNLILSKGDIKLSEAEKQQLASKKNEHYKQLLNNLSPSDILPGAVELLSALKKEGIKIALASASQNAPMILSQLQIQGFFDLIVDPTKLGAGKPDPEIFMTAAEYFNVDYCDCLGIEDADAGVEAIVSSGMIALRVGSQNNASKAHLSVKGLDLVNLAQLKSLFSTGSNKVVYDDRNSTGV